MRKIWLATGLLALAGSAALADKGDMQPDVGKEPAELQTKEWINSDGRTTFAQMKGEVVLLASWKTG